MTTRFEQYQRISVLEPREMLDQLATHFGMTYNAEPDSMRKVVVLNHVTGQGFVKLRWTDPTNPGGGPINLSANFDCAAGNCPVADGSGPHG